MRYHAATDHALAPAAELLQLSDHEYEAELKHA